MRTTGVDRSKLRASLQLLLLAFVLLAVGALASGCIKSGEASVSEPGDSRPAMAIEIPSPGDVMLPFRIAGWAVDLSAEKGTGVDRVEILDDGCEGTVIGIATYGIHRSDVGATFGSPFAPSGWQFLVETLSPGRYALGVRARSTVTAEFNQCQSLSVNVK